MVSPETVTGPDPPRIYVASLSDYNAGRLHGTWLDATGDADELWAGINNMLADSTEPIAEEWAIHDYENWGAWAPSEYESIDTVATVAAGIAEHGPAYAAWVAYHGEIPDDAGFEDQYLGEWPSMQAYAEELVNDMGVHIIVEPYGWTSYVHFDTEALARDLAIEMATAETPDGGVYLFSP